MYISIIVYKYNRGEQIQTNFGNFKESKKLRNLKSNIEQDKESAHQSFTT